MSTRLGLLALAVPILLLAAFLFAGAVGSISRIFIGHKDNDDLTYLLAGGLYLAPAILLALAGIALVTGSTKDRG